MRLRRRPARRVDPVEAERDTLRSIVAEAVIRQDQAEALLAEIRDRRPLAEIAPRGGALVSRFVALRRALPVSLDPDVRHVNAILRMVFDHHALAVKCSVDLLALDWRSQPVVEQLERIDGLGAPAQWLETVRDELRG
jgi:hypothetical protein